VRGLSPPRRDALGVTIDYENIHQGERELFKITRSTPKKKKKRDKAAKLARYEKEDQPLESRKKERRV